MSVSAHFWFAPGVEVFAGLSVPNPPPFVYRFAAKAPIDFTLSEEEYTPASVVVPQAIDFRRVQWSPTGEVAHYEIDNAPPAGWRWLAVNGSIRTERVCP